MQGGIEWAQAPMILLNGGRAFGLPLSHAERSEPLGAQRCFSTVHSAQHCAEPRHAQAWRGGAPRFRAAIQLSIWHAGWREGGRSPPELGSGKARSAVSLLSVNKISLVFFS